MRKFIGSRTNIPCAYSEEHLTELFPTTCLCFEASGSSAVATAAVDFAIEDGKTYLVTLDLIEHECIAADGAIRLGNLSISAAAGEMTATLPAAGHHHLRIIVVEEKVTPLPAKYLPETGLPPLIGTFTKDESSGAANGGYCSITEDEAREAIQQGRMIFIDGNLITASNVSPKSVALFCYFVAGSTLYISSFSLSNNTQSGKGAYTLVIMRTAQLTEVTT